ncbi:hypothetical protein [Amycolatopsis sp. cmx-4-83]|uniref:hypothetical protein n=1 Tax=Amycolatopsis sp. cmx-4-83 TaxID=2790940 RepID=UPI00397D40FF
MDVTAWSNGACSKLGSTGTGRPRSAPGVTVALWAAEPDLAELTARPEGPERNAIVYDSTGTPLLEGTLGDGIEHVRTSAGVSRKARRRWARAGWCASPPR